MTSDLNTFQIYNKVFGFKIFPRQISMLFYDFCRLFMDLQLYNCQIVYSVKGGNKQYIENLVTLACSITKSVCYNIKISGRNSKQREQVVEKEKEKEEKSSF